MGFENLESYIIYSNRIEDAINIMNYTIYENALKILEKVYSIQ